MTARDASVWLSPGLRGGEPCISGTRLPTAQVAALVWDGSMETVRHGWPYLTDGQILVACWYEVTNGNRRYWRKRFQDWPREWSEVEWRERHALTAAR